MTNALTPDYVAQEIAGAGQLTVKELMALTGKAETTVRNVLKTLVEELRVVKIDDAKPAAYRVPTETEAEVLDTEDVEVIDPEIIAESVAEAEAAEEAKLNKILGAITADVDEPKVKKSRKIAKTDVPDEHNERVRVNGESVWVTEAYPRLDEVPQFIDVTEVFGVALEADEVPAGENHTAEQIAAVYYRVVAEYLELMLDEEAITRPVWYGRTCRLRHLVVGHGRGTALAKPVGKSSDK